ncbi:MAG: UspA domain protein [Acidobacteria bacterium]|jgi:nucleotide-binding universal stress UspA family protein|nr:UspA domain protein [Acidobacteriota bacterium]
MERHTIVLGYAPTTTGRLALDRAVQEAKLRGSRLLVVLSMWGGKKTAFDEVAQARQALEEAEDRLKAEGVSYELRELVRGKSPAQDLADLAAEEKADLIVIGYRHRTKSGKFFLGSDAQDILLAAPCPVLLVRPPEGDEG